MKSKFNLHFFIKQIEFVGLENPLSKAIYVEVNDKIEKWTSLLFWSFVKVSLPFVALPKILISFCSYFMTDAGSDAFELPFPMR